VKLNSKWIVVVLVLVGLASCRTSPLVNYETIDIVNGSGNDLTMDQVQNAIMIAGQPYGWKMEIIEPGRIFATLKLRVHVAIVDIEFNTKQYSITYKGSTKLKYKKNSDGKESIHSNYLRWIQTLKNSINQELLRL
jgi:hypothetical protein